MDYFLTMQGIGGQIDIFSKFKIDQDRVKSMTIIIMLSV